MKKIVELVTQWSEYETEHPDAEIAAFCRYYLVREKQKKELLKFARSPMPPQTASVLAKMLGRIGRLLNNYAVIALRQCGLSGFEDFFYLNDIHANHRPKKTEVINANFHELSSGLLILGRLKKNGLIVEMPDDKDKRSKRLTLTKKGLNVLRDCHARLETINGLFFKEMSEEDMMLCSQLLSATESRYSLKWIEDKKKSFSELLRSTEG